MSKHALVIVSNRLPVNVTRRDGVLVFEASSGGLATAMSSLEHDDRIWVGWPGIPSDNLTSAEKKQISHELAKHNCYPVHLTEKEVELFYEGYANDTLWPLFHYFQSLAKYDDTYWRAYRQANKIFMRAVNRVAKDDAAVWIHDYHLMILPGLIRASMPNTSIGYFLHIPFPSYEIYRLLPERKEILTGLLGADLIGFHVYDYARHFISSCLRLLGVESHHGALRYDGRTIKTDAFPISIDYSKFRKTLVKESTKKAIKTFEEAYGEQKLIISVDRLDYSKGIPQRLEAFRILLEENPEYIGKVKMLMIAVPSRTEVETYQHLRETIEQSVSRINGTYGTMDWAPISYQFQNRPFEEIVALYAAADIALVTPIRDGMNLVAKEYVASKMNQPGVLILSEMTGAIDELPEALSINPNDAKSIARAIRQGLNMSKREQLQRLSAMQRRISTYTVQTWGADFMHDLALASGQRQHDHEKRLTKSGWSEIVNGYHTSESRLIILDYDGTLRGFSSSPSAAASKPTPKLRAILTKLANDPSTQLAIVSGRPKKTLQEWFGNLSVTLIAEHGAWTKYDGKWSHTESDFSHIKKKVRPILDKCVSRTAGSTVEEKDYAVVWHYRNVPTELAYVRANELRRELVNELASEDIGVFNGEKIIEIKPNDIHKGYAASELEAVYQSDFILCAGDDYTDEDMFRELPDSAHTIKIGIGETKARHQLSSVEKMVALLEELVK